jgi:ubiquitin-like modifier-activating enzyme ATG7
MKFATFSSEIELPFYSALSSLKIDYDRLDVSARHVLGLYGPPVPVASEDCRMQILGNALTSNQ